MSRKEAPSASPRPEHGTPSRWDQYRALLVAKRIPQQALGWYLTQVQAFLNAVQPDSLEGLSQVAPSTQGVALNALVFLFHEVLARPLDGLKCSRIKRREPVPVVLTRDEVERLPGVHQGDLWLDRRTALSMIYTPVLKRPGMPPVKSPADF